MSPIKRFLASQRDDFISLHDLLEMMTQQGGGCSLAEAAAVLSQVLDLEAIDPWVSYTPTKGLEQILRIRGRPFRPDELLAYAANNGAFEEDPFDVPF